MATEADMRSLFDACAARIVDLGPREWHSYRVEDLMPDCHVGGQAATWARSPGLYFFLSGDQVMYIGRATDGVGLRSRVLNQISDRRDDRWRAVLESPGARVVVVAFTAVDWYWVVALECALIEGMRKLGPLQFNKRKA